MTLLADITRLDPQKTYTVTFDAPRGDAGKHPFLTFKARADQDTLGTPLPWSLRLELNGKAIDLRRMANPAMRAIEKTGSQTICWTPVGIQPLQANDHLAGGSVWVWRAPNFTDANTHPDFINTASTRRCEYELDLAGLLTPTDNTLTFISEAGCRRDPALPVIIADVELRMQSPAVEIRPPAPTGSIPTIVPQATFAKTYSVETSHNAAMTISVGGARFDVRSRFSAPDGKWYDASNAYFQHERQVIEHDEWIEVRDTFVNLLDDDLPIMQEHRCPLGDELDRVWLCGVEAPGKQGVRKWGENPSAFATTSQAGIGMVALNDAFRAHIAASYDVDGHLNLADKQFMIPANGRYTSELAIVPTALPDFWSFINATRRLMDANFTIDLLFTFVPPTNDILNMSDAALRRFVENRSANFFAQHLRSVHPDTEALHGTAFQSVTHEACKAAFDRLKAMDFDRRIFTAVYYCCFIDSTDSAITQFADDAYRDRDGHTMGYQAAGVDITRHMILSTLDNAYGRYSARNIDTIVNTIGADGLYWDEFTWSKTLYTYGTLDGCSADIDPDTFKIVQRKGSICMLSDSFKQHHIERLRSRGVRVYGNGAPVTRTLAKLKPISFAETGRPDYVRSSLLHTPIALGDHRSEVDEVDVYRSMHKALDNGCIYTWYSPYIEVLHKTLTEYMYPFTPIELHEGYVIGEERILTNRSGVFGWGDQSGFEAHVFDASGRETTQIDIPIVRQDGCTYAEVRLPGGYACALIRSN